MTDSELQRRRTLASMTKPELIEHIIQTEDRIRHLRDRIEQAYRQP